MSYLTRVIKIPGMMSAQGSELSEKRCPTTVTTMLTQLAGIRYKACYQRVAIAMETSVNASISTQSYYYYFIILETK